ncbi:hypothetical protein SAMN04488109_0030 [Chryseolinea serpens]|uniref:Uncharacterized protein n=2 Tax=Chryseolinea serpens TaxID=947013 RepID=A0A1M5JFN6_9BACT|nr:hypothetical protein SAMN04488109_0030 [Chryseolinea serpens]
MFCVWLLAACTSKHNESTKKERPSIKDRFKTGVINLRQAGLFEDYKSLSDDSLTQRLSSIATERQLWEEFDVYDSLQEEDYINLKIAQLDPKRVWWHDLEADVLNGNMVYASTVKEFVELSGGYLRAEQIKEEWETDNGPIHISFQDGDTLRAFQLKSYDDWYDEDFFNYMEKFMTANGSPYKFYVYIGTGQDAFVIRLTKAEKEMVEQKMRWKMEKF